MNIYRLYYLPTGRFIKEVEAKSELSAKRKFGYHNWQLHTVKKVD